MKHVKSERLKRLEAELYDLQQWLKLGLVPKKDVEKHKEEIQAVFDKIEAEKERLQFLKESGEAEEYVTPKKSAARPAGYIDMPTIPDIEGGETAAAIGDTGFDMESEGIDMENSMIEERGDEDEGGDEGDDERAGEEEEDAPFSDRNRWRRGGIIDPDADDW